MLAIDVQRSRSGAPTTPLPAHRLQSPILIPLPFPSHARGLDIDTAKSDSDSSSLPLPC
jgi:hypothetical protein